MAVTDAQRTRSHQRSSAVRGPSEGLLPAPAAGLTLTEMLVVLGILSVLLVATVPFVTTFMRRGEMGQAVTVIQGAALRARSLAIERRENHDLVLDEANRRVYVRRTADAAKPVEDAIVGQAYPLPRTVRLILWRQDASTTFTPAGGLTSSTRLGFYLIGVTEAEGTVNTVGANDLSVAGNPWTPDNKFRNYYVVFTTGGDGVKGQARLIASSDSNTLTIQGAWSPTEVAWKAPSSGDKFVVVAPNHIRHLVIYSTTGQVKAGLPPKGP